MTDVVPVTLVTGFLGAGKTTLLNRILSSPDSPPIAVIVNEFGSLGIDGRLIVGAAEDVVELRNGCVCCEVRDDLRAAAIRLLQRRGRRFRGLPFAHLLVETSGLAAPGPLLQTFLLDSTLARQTRIDGVVTLAHAALLDAQLRDHPEVAAQLAHADVVLLNHADRVEDPDSVRRIVAAVAPLTHVATCVRANVPLSPLLDIGTTDPTKWSTPALVAHSAGIVTRSLRTSNALDLPKLKMFLQFVAARRGWQVLRQKGIFRCGGVATAVVAHGVYQWLELGPSPLPAPAESGLVVIGRGVDVGELERGWAAMGG